MKTTAELNQFRNEVNKVINALKFQQDKLRSLQTKCDHSQVSNCRCNICLRKFVNEDYIAKKPLRKDAKPITDFQFFLLTMILFAKGYTIIKDSKYRNKTMCRWERKTKQTWEGKTGTRVVQMRMDATISTFVELVNTECIWDQILTFNEFIKLK
jgi:hypothetical protein